MSSLLFQILLPRPESEVRRTEVVFVASALFEQRGKPLKKSELVFLVKLFYLRKYIIYI